MGLPASQRRILEKIENALRGTDPRLTSLFAIFSRLTRDEEMPRIEQLRARAVVLLIRLPNRPDPARRGVRAMSPVRHRAVIFFPIALLVVASTLIMAAALPSPPRCAPVVAGLTGHNAPVKTKSRSRSCSPPVVFFAR